MKKILIIIIFLPILISCSKGHDAESKIDINVPVGTIKATIDGIETTFNVDARATFDTVPWTSPAVQLAIKGKSENSNSSNNIYLWFFVTPIKEIDAGKYPDLNKQIYHYLELNKNFNGSIYNWGSNRTTGNNSTSTLVRNDSLVQGIFSGVVAIGFGPNANEPQPPLTYQIENGIFNVRLVR